MQIELSQLILVLKIDQMKIAFDNIQTILKYKLCDIYFNIFTNNCIFSLKYVLKLKICINMNKFNVALKIIYIYIYN